MTAGEERNEELSQSLSSARETLASDVASAAETITKEAETMKQILQVSCSPSLSLVLSSFALSLVFLSLS